MNDLDAFYNVDKWPGAQGTMHFVFSVLLPAVYIALNVAYFSIHTNASSPFPLPFSVWEDILVLSCTMIHGWIMMYRILCAPNSPPFHLSPKTRLWICCYMTIVLCFRFLAYYGGITDPYIVFSSQLSILFHLAWVFRVLLFRSVLQCCIPCVVTSPPFPANTFHLGVPHEDEDRTEAEEHDTRAQRTYDLSMTHGATSNGHTVPCAVPAPVFAQPVHSELPPPS